MPTQPKPTRSETGSAASIVKAARSLFLKRGYEGVNLDAIAKKASVSRQTLYNNFGSKEAVFKAMLNDHWSSVAERAAADRDEIAGAATANELLTKFAHRMLGFMESVDQVDFTRLVIAESRRAPWIGREFYEIGKGPLIRSFARTLEEWTQSGRLACKSPLLAAHQFFGLVLELTFWPYVMVVGPATSELPSPEQAVEEAVTTFLARYGV